MVDIGKVERVVEIERNGNPVRTTEPAPAREPVRARWHQGASGLRMTWTDPRTTGALVLDGQAVVS